MRDTTIDFDDNIWFEVDTDGLSVHSEYDNDTPIPFDRMEEFIDMMRKIRKDVQDGTFVFKPDSLMLDIIGVKIKECPCCGGKGEATIHTTLAWNSELYSGADPSATFLYKRGIPYRYIDYYECECKDCGYSLYEKGDSDRPRDERLIDFHKAIRRWETEEPSESAKAKSAEHIEAKRLYEESKRKYQEMREAENARFNARRDDVKRMLGWLDE